METEFSTTLSPPRAACTGEYDLKLNVQNCEGCLQRKLYFEPECKEVYSHQYRHHLQVLLNLFIFRELGWTDGEKVTVL